MIFTLIVRSNLFTNHTAFKFAEAVLAEQHKINGIYFLLDGVYLANQFIDMPTDEPNINLQWRRLAQMHELDLIVCAASGLRRGVNANNVLNSFKIGSIGQLVESCAYADRVVSL